MRGGQGWLHYDAVFRQQIQSFDGGGAKFCPDCQMADHNREDCALNPARSMPVIQLSSRDRPRTGGGGGGGGGGQERRKRARVMACFAYNDDRSGCPKSAANCRFEHVCSKCFEEDHKRSECNAKPREKQAHGGQ